MKLCVIYNIWSDSVELLRGSLMCIKHHVDLVIIVYQTTSNFGEYADPYEDIMNACKVISLDKVITYKYDPNLSWGGAANETAKRNLGIGIAHGKCTHFLMMDSDEYYEDFGKAKQEYFDSGMAGSVCKMWTYFKKPTLIFEFPDNYFVPFIHKLDTDTKVGNFNRYPFYVDPTRRVNTESVAELKSLMHHFSYCRKDIEMKIRNSSARKNIEKSDLLKDYHNPEIGHGFYVKDFRQKLVECINIFGIEI